MVVNYPNAKSPCVILRFRGTDSRILGDETFIERVLGKKREKLRRGVSLHRVLKEVCKHYLIKKEDPGASGKDRRLSEVGGVVAWLILELGVVRWGNWGR